jgi:YidC/Oxa1 family membrane protein insertase
VDIINNAIFYILHTFQNLTGSYALAIILITVLLRVVLWPMNSSQIRSMKKMQEIQPKLKQLQERYKDEPQKMQEAMMKFYTENKFNPLAGCLPMLLQLPIFIGLYGALNSPQFLAEASHDPFLFINNLSHTLYGHSGESMDNRFSVQANDTFSTDKLAMLSLTSGKEREHTVKDTNKVIQVSPHPIIPGEPIRLTLNMEALGLSEDYDQLLREVRVPVVNMQTKELEKVVFTNQTVRGRNVLASTVPTVPAQTQFHIPVLVLILLYGALMWMNQKLMKTATPAGDSTQAQMAKLMPLMFFGMLFVIPIPAGVMLYLVVTTVLMIVQTWWVQRNDDSNSSSNDTPSGKPSDTVVTIKPNGA